LAVGCFTAATGRAGSVFASEEPDSDTLANLPGCDARTNLLDAANYFVAWNTRIRYAGELPVNGSCVGMTHTASLYADTHLSRTRRCNDPLDKAKSTGRRNFDRFICSSHFRLLLIRKIHLPALTRIPEMQQFKNNSVLTR
jgi:hypothetical protein